MPNHTATILEITGPEEDILRFKNQAASKTDSHRKLDFNNFVPMPKELEDTRVPARIMTQEEIDSELAAWQAKKDSGQPCFSSLNVGITQETYDKLVEAYGCSDWYEWRHKYWGTKWNTYSNGDWKLNELGCWSLYYETAWSAATAFYTAVSSQFPTLYFKHTYADEGSSFIGYELFKSGKITAQLDAEWDSPKGVELQKKLGVYYKDED